MKKKMLCTLLMAMLLLSLTACGAGGRDSVTSTDSGPSASTGSSNSYGGWDSGSDAYRAEGDNQTAAEDINGTIPAEAKMIFTADLELETQDFDAASAAISQMTTDFGGWFESRRISESGGSRYLYCIIRVPANNFSALLDRAGEAAHVVERSEDGLNVSEAYYDTEARLTTQRTKLERLQLLLSQAESMEDIISLESAISETELEIEYLTGSLRHYDSLIGYSTVTIHLCEVYRLSSDEEVPVTFGQRLGAALASGLRSGVEGLEDFIIDVARNWITVLIWIVILVVLVVLLRRHGKRKKKNIFPPPPPPPQSKE